MFKDKKYIINLFIIALVVGIIVFPKKTVKYEQNIPKEEKILADGATPQIVKPYYSKNHFVVADMVLSPASGDRSDDIQYALNVCDSNGGGTVYLERGIYNVSKPITIYSNCTLMGDWQDPDNYQGTLDYGTKIVVDVNNFSNKSSGLFILNSSAGAEGLTIYYKNQNLSKPVSQSWTFNYKGAMLFTIKDVTLINSYNGIGRTISNQSAHEMLMIENVKGTILNIGVSIDNSADVGTITGLTFSPKYWANANLKAFDDNVSNLSETSIADAIKSRGGMGLKLADVEQSQYVNIILSGFKYGVYVPDASVIKPRAMGSGSFYNLNIYNCNTGFMVENGQYDGKSLVDYRWGYVISNSTIEGSDYAIYNGSPLIRDNYGTLKLNDVSIKGKVDGIGKIIHNSGTSYNSVSKNVDQTGKITNSNRFPNLTLSRTKKNNGNNLKVLTNANSVDEINNALSSVSSNGGGVVYLKPGVYKISKTINVPSNVELRGAAASSSRIFSRGTVISVTANVTAVSINGNNSGVYGINFIYESNVNSLKSSKSYSSYNYSIVANNSSDVYVKNVAIAGASHGIYFNGCSNFSIENIVTGVIDSAIRVDNSSNGLIMNCLQNGTVISRNELVNYGSESHIFDYVFPNTNSKLVYISLNNDKSIEVQNCFTYGTHIFIYINGSSVYSVNSGTDGSGGTFYQLNNAEGWLVNGLKVNGTTVSGSGNFGIYNNLCVGNVNESDRSSTISKPQPITTPVPVTPVPVTPTTIPVTPTPATPVPSTSTKGDINGDGRISSQDYVLIRQSILGMVTFNSTQKSTADMNNDGKVSSMDYILVKKIILGNTSTPQPVTSTPTVNKFTQTSLQNTIINSSNAKTTICNLGSDSSGLKTIEYSTSCSSTKSASISNGCATITIEACKNGSLTYKLKNSSNYSSSVTVNDIGKYLIYGQVYNQLLYANTEASNNENNITSWVNNGKSVSESVKSIGKVAINDQVGASNETIVKKMYKGLLGRDADSSGLNTWVNALNSSSRENVLSSIINSDEAKSIYSAWGYN